MVQDLFRKEVLDARRTQWLGTISLAQPLRLWVLTLFAAFAALVIVVFLLLGSYTRRSTVAGQLVPSKGLVTVPAPATGVISQLDRAEGDALQVGQRLAVVTASRATPEIGDTQAALEQGIEQRREGLVSIRAAQRSQLQVQANGLRAQLATARGELVQIEAELVTRQDQSNIAKETLAKLKQLEDNHYVSALQIQQQESTALEYKAQTQALLRQAIAIRRNIAQIEQSLHEVPGQQQASQATLQRDLGQLAQERIETQTRGALVINAPITGIVAAQLIKAGQVVQAGQPLMNLLPEGGDLEAELLVPSRAIGFIEPGDAVQLRYQAYPYQKFGHQLGKVRRISRSALSSSELGALAGNAQQSEPYYRITVTLARQTIMAYGKVEPLRPGMLLEADVLGEKRRLIEWVFEPLYSLNGRLSN